jgi:hypothetical protein
MIERFFSKIGQCQRAQPDTTNSQPLSSVRQACIELRATAYAPWIATRVFIDRSVADAI